MPSILRAQVKIPCNVTSKELRVLPSRRFSPQQPEQHHLAFSVPRKSHLAPRASPGVPAILWHRNPNSRAVTAGSKATGKPETLSMWPVCISAMAGTPSPRQYARFRTGRMSRPPMPLFLLGLALFPEPLWIPWRPQKAVKCGRSVAFRGRAVEEKGFFFPLLSKQKEGPPSSKARIAFAKLYSELREGERAPAGSENWKAIQDK